MFIVVTPDLQSPLSIGAVEIRNHVILAPMSGVTDLPFRRLAWRFGAGLVVTEMIASRELARGTPQSQLRMAGEGMSPHMVQLAGREAHWMAEAARIAVDHGAEIIDINMGCPAKKVIGGYAGSALMRDPDYALSLIEATVSAVDVPVTLKMRLGWDETMLNAAEIARRAEAAGIRMITVHGRTRCQFYEGKADWQAIAGVREAVTVPFVANGDIASAQDAARILEMTGADAIMIGRAAQGRPWLLGQIACEAAAPSEEMLLDVVIEHYSEMLVHYGRDVGVRHARKHLGWYLDRFASGCDPVIRSTVMRSAEPDEVMRALHAALSPARAASSCEAKWSTAA
ncbi:MAG TPA: tRNA dihydrouridine synthase DusB [Pararhizobium sp.]|nr:tRNA dihydrouridine synthase DusB [Pararhizobium sp.]